jgi:hypothetical protein
MKVPTMKSDSKKKKSNAARRSSLSIVKQTRDYRPKVKSVSVTGNPTSTVEGGGEGKR